METLGFYRLNEILGKCSMTPENPPGGGGEDPPKPPPEPK
jgi:hypothetical protein